ncbi:MAG: phosphoribosylaminoimidazolesuccinocarboxamide synthase [Pseudomonadota bacterium]
MGLRLPEHPLLSTELALPNRRQGKVRDLYDVSLGSGEAALLLVATDRVSAFDVVLGSGLPGKGVVLTQLSRFWFERFASYGPNHLLSTDVGDVPGLTPVERDLLAGRIMLCRRTQVVPIECIARGYLAGSGWKDYQNTGTLCGVELPPGLERASKLPEAIFTPSTKAASGHDENIDFSSAAALVGVDTMMQLRERTLALYGAAATHAEGVGLLLADTKFEFGLLPGADEPVLIDEACTPDSSRFWPKDDWKAGHEPPSFDKQIVRNFLEAEVDAGRWNREAPGPMLPTAVLRQTLDRYLEAYERLVGHPLVRR